MHQGFIQRSIVRNGFTVVQDIPHIHHPPHYSRHAAVLSRLVGFLLKLEARGVGVECGRFPGALRRDDLRS